MMLTMTKKKKRTDRIDPELQFERLDAEVIAAIPEIRSSEQIKEFGERRDELEAAIKEGEQRLRDYIWRPPADGDDEEGVRRAATSSTISEAASEYLKTGEMERFGGSEDAAKDALRHRVMVLREALQLHQDRYGRIHQRAVQEHLSEIEPFIRETAAEVVAAGRVFLETLKKQSELLNLARRRGFSAEFCGWIPDNFEAALLGGGLGEPLEHYLGRKSQQWSTP